MHLENAQGREAFAIGPYCRSSMSLLRLASGTSGLSGGSGQQDSSEYVLR